MSVKLNSHPVHLQIDTATDITLISQRLWKTIGLPPLTSTRHVAWSTSGDCVHIPGELPVIIKIEDKTASGKIYVADLRHNLLGLDFIESLGLLDIPLNWLVVWVLWHINLCRLFNAKSIFIQIISLVQFSMSTQFVKNISISSYSAHSKSSNSANSV